MYLLLLIQQHIPEHAKPAAVAIAEGGSSALTQTIVVAIAGALGGWVFRTFIGRPNEKAEQYEEAKLKAVIDNLSEHKQNYQRTLTEWQVWRDHTAERITRLELETKNMRETMNEKIKDLASDVAETKDISVEIRETLAGLKSQMDATIKKWGS